MYYISFTFINKRSHGSVVFFAALLLTVMSLAAVAQSDTPRSASPWAEAEVSTFEIDGRVCTVVAPGERADDAPWLLCANRPAADAVLEQQLLAKGFHIVWLDVEDLYGNAAAVALWDAVYARARDQFGLAAKPAIACRDHGALLAYNWAAQHSAQVACLYAETPWLRLEPTLDRRDDDSVSADAMKAHGVETSEHNGTPMGQAALIGEANIAVMHVYGPRRPGLPSDKDVQQFYAAYRMAGGRDYEGVVQPQAAMGARTDTTIAAMVFLLSHTGHLSDAPLGAPIVGAPEWQVADFSGRAAVRVLDDVLVLEKGDDMTGITCVDAPPRVNYEITLDAMRLSGGDFFCGLTAPYKDTSFSLVVGGWGGTCVGISSLDWLDAYHNETARFRSFDDHRWYRIRLRVTEDTILAWIDGDEVVNIVVADRDVDIRWEMEPTNPLGIASWRTTGAVKNFNIRTFKEITRASVR